MNKSWHANPSDFTFDIQQNTPSEYRMNVNSLDGERVGYLIFTINPDNKSAFVEHIALYDEKMEGHGIGRLMYRNLQDFLHNNYDGVRYLGGISNENALRALNKVFGDPVKQPRINRYEEAYNDLPIGVDFDYYDTVHDIGSRQVAPKQINKDTLTSSLFGEQN